MKYEQDGHQIFQGDALDILRESIPDGSVDLIFADPPYNIGKKFGDFYDKWPSDKDYALWCEGWLSLCISKLKPTGAMYVMASTQAMPYLDIFLRDRMHILSRIVWNYDSSGVQARNYFGSVYEPILFCVKDKKNYKFNSEAIAVEARTGSQRKLIDYRKVVPAPYNTRKVPGNVWNMPRVRYRMEEYEEHPTQKPEIFLKRIILASTDEGDVVLDPFAGTFTTCAVAKKLGRISTGIELNKGYVEVGLRRVFGLTTIDGKTLEAPKKNTVRKNGNGRRSVNSSSVAEKDLFDVHS